MCLSPKIDHIGTVLDFWRVTFAKDIELTHVLPSDGLDKYRCDQNTKPWLESRPKTSIRLISWMHPYSGICCIRNPNCYGRLTAADICPRRRHLQNTQLWLRPNILESINCLFVWKPKMMQFFQVSRKHAEVTKGFLRHAVSSLAVCSRLACRRHLHTQILCLLPLPLPSSRKHGNCPSFGDIPFVPPPSWLGRS